MIDLLTTRPDGYHWALIEEPGRWSARLVPAPTLGDKVRHPSIVGEGETIAAAVRDALSKVTPAFLE